LASGHPINVLHVNNIDLYGRRFNGYDLLGALTTRGIMGQQAVLTKLSRNPNVIPLIQTRADENLHGALARVEERHSMNNLLFPWGRRLMELECFGKADVLHCHLIHNQVVSLFDLPDISRSRPTVWTLHDPWPLTGHCIYPRQCQKWLTGCEACPSLDALFPMREDRANRMWRVKRDVYARIDVDIVVASEFMMDLVRGSPLTSAIDRVHLIPFGVDVSAYLPDSSKAESRRLLGIPEDHFVLLFRATPSEVKGLRYISAALRLRRPQRNTTLLTVDRKGLMRELSGPYNVVDLGWVENEALHPHIYSACDVFLMPSTAEAFGLMALEAMAAGRPVVCFEGTSLPRVTRSPRCGISVPSGDVEALREAIDRLSSDPEEARRRGELGRLIAKSDFSYERYLDSLAELYESVFQRAS
jgi:glycosyltransferase involved in cell wall biosynthesis